MVGQRGRGRETLRREVLMFCICEHSQSVATSLSLKQVTTHKKNLEGFLRAKWRARGFQSVSGALADLWRLNGRFRIGCILVAIYVH
jgi:hypothetical protein